MPQTFQEDPSLAPIRDEKRRLRAEARARLELTVTESDRPAISAKGCARLAGTIAMVVPAGSTIGLYFPLKYEIDVLQVREKLGDRYAWAFPEVVQVREPLQFRLADAEELVTGAFKVREPRKRAPVVRPDLVVVPALACDAEGYRLGHGAGFYDRTLEQLKGVPTIGFIYDFQRVERLPRTPSDVPVGLVITDAAVVPIRRR